MQIQIQILVHIQTQTQNEIQNIIQDPSTINQFPCSAFDAPAFLSARARIYCFNLSPPAGLWNYPRTLDIEIGHPAMEHRMTLDTGHWIICQCASRIGCWTGVWTSGICTLDFDILSLDIGQPFGHWALGIWTLGIWTLDLDILSLDIGQPFEVWFIVFISPLPPWI